jgi:myosin heavy subunit
MVDMENLNEAELLYNIRVRYEQNKIFTYVGPTLLAINPYMLIPELFKEDVLKYFQNKCNEPRFQLKEHQPHIFAIAGDVYRSLFENRRNQAIVISGESGAGKTEETKLAMKFMTSMGFF